MRVNFSDAEARGNGFDAFRGRYHVAITNFEETETKNEGKLPAGTPGCTLEFTVQEGPMENRKIWNNFWFAKSTLGFLQNCLRATGEYSEDELADENFDLDPDRIIGLHLVVKTKIQAGTQGYEDRTVISKYEVWDEDEDFVNVAADTASTSGSFLPS